MPQLNKVLRLTKVNEQTRTFYGTAQAAVPDADGEQIIYEPTKGAFQRWSDDTLRATSIPGMEPSRGNLRLQHSMEIFGKTLRVDYDDQKQTISILGTPANDAMYKLLTGGFLTGLSIAGDYAERYCSVCKTDMRGQGRICPRCNTKTVVLYVPRIVEVSAVDRPAVASATFQYIKSSGEIELRKFAKGAVNMFNHKEAASLHSRASAAHTALSKNFTAGGAMHKAHIELADCHKALSELHSEFANQNPEPLESAGRWNGEPSMSIDDAQHEGKTAMPTFGKRSSASRMDELSQSFYKRFYATQDQELAAHKDAGERGGL